MSKAPKYNIGDHVTGLVSGKSGVVVSRSEDMTWGEWNYLVHYDDGSEPANKVPECNLNPAGNPYEADYLKATDEFARAKAAHQAAVRHAAETKSAAERAAEAQRTAWEAVEAAERKMITARNGYVAKVV